MASQATAFACLEQLCRSFHSLHSHLLTRSKPGGPEQAIWSNKLLAIRSRHIFGNIILHWKDVGHGAHCAGAESSGAVRLALLAGSCSVAQAEESSASGGKFQAADCHSEAILYPVA